MTAQLLSDQQQLANLLQEVTREAHDFLQNIDAISTQPHPHQPEQIALPAKGMGATAALELFQKEFRHLIAASTGPRYWGFVTGGTTPAALAGDWLASVYDQNTQRTAQGGDCSAIIELHTIQLALDLFRLPKYFAGGTVTGATMSNFTCLATARQWAGVQRGKDIARVGIQPGDVVVLSAEPHSSVIKCLSLLGIGSANIVLLKKMEGREAMDIPDLKEKLQQYVGIPVIVATSGGTVNTVDFDNLQPIAAMKKQYTFWWHVDAAFGGFAACSPAYQHLLNGWEDADSITIDCHKWMNVPYENALYFIQKQHSRLQLQVFQNSNAPYLGNPEENFSYGNLSPENSRRFRALPIWFTLMAYGKEGYQEIVERNIQQARALGAWIAAQPQLQLLAPVRLNCVCFTVKEKPEASGQLLQQINATGKLFMTPTKLDGVPGMRAALVNWRTSDEDIEIAKQVILEALRTSL